jgi:hypothetical protein
VVSCVEKLGASEAPVLGISAPSLHMEVPDLVGWRDLLVLLNARGFGRRAFCVSDGD